MNYQNEKNVTKLRTFFKFDFVISDSQKNQYKAISTSILNKNLKKNK